MTQVLAPERIVTSKHNNPPELAPLEAARELISELDLEALNWFDGTPIENQAQSDEVARLIDAARKARTSFDNDRKAEKKPHDDLAKAVDASWKPLISDAERIVEVAKAAQTPWLIQLEAEKLAAEKAAKAIAEEKAAEALRLAKEADGSLAAARARDAAIEVSKRANQIAMKAANDKAGAKGAGMDRKIGLRTNWKAEVADHRALLNYVAKFDPFALRTFLDDWAARAVRGGKHEIPGVKAWEERSVA